MIMFSLKETLKTEVSTVLCVSLVTQEVHLFVTTSTFTFCLHSLH